MIAIRRSLAIAGLFAAWAWRGRLGVARGGQGPRADRGRAEQPQLADHDPADEGRPGAFGPVHGGRGDDARPEVQAIGLGAFRPISPSMTWC